MSGSKLKQCSLAARRVMLSLLLSLVSPLCFSVEIDKAIKLVSFINPPYVFESGSNEPGLLKHIISHLFARSNMHYELVLMPKKRAIIYAEMTDNTCVLPIERSQEREVKFTWISPILISNTGLFSLPGSHSDSPLITLTDAISFRIGSHLGSASGKYLTDMGFKVEAVPKNSSNIYKLKAGRIDLWESDVLTAGYIANQSGIVISKSVLDFFTHLHAIGCNPSIPTAKIERIRNSLKQMYRDGTIDRLNRDFMR